MPEYTRILLDQSPVDTAFRESDPPEYVLEATDSIQMPADSATLVSDSLSRGPDLILPFTWNLVLFTEEIESQYLNGR